MVIRKIDPPIHVKVTWESGEVMSRDCWEAKNRQEHVPLEITGYLIEEVFPDVFREKSSGYKVVEPDSSRKLEQRLRDVYIIPNSAICSVEEIGDMSPENLPVREPSLWEKISVGLSFIFVLVVLGLIVIKIVLFS